MSAWRRLILSLELHKGNSRNWECQYYKENGDRGRREMIITHVSLRDEPVVFRVDPQAYPTQKEFIPSLPLFYQACWGSLAYFPSACPALSDFTCLTRSWANTPQWITHSPTCLWIQLHFMDEETVLREVICQNWCQNL